MLANMGLTGNTIHGVDTYALYGIKLGRQVYV